MELSLCKFCWKLGHDHHVLVQLCLLYITMLVGPTVSHGSGLRGSLLAKFVALAQPEQVHIAFGNTTRDMVIMWATRKHAKLYVEMAKTTNYSQKIEAQTLILSKENYRGSKYLHRVYLSNLTPGETYMYRIIGDSGTNSNLFRFRIPTTKPKRVYTFMLVADVGLRSKDLKFLTYEARIGKYEAVFHVGDIAYNLHGKEGRYGDQFLKHVEKFASEVPYMTVPGDHERFHDYTHYRYRFSMPNTPWPMPMDHLWYSLDIGPVHFITINTEVFYTLLDQLGRQLQWLQSDLQKANRDRDQHPWIIVLGHRPMYCSLTDSVNESDLDCANMTDLFIRSKLEDLFFEEGVDLYISGHQHNYERSWPMYRGKAFQLSYANPKAPIHIVNGAMGYEYLTETFTEPYPWSAHRLADNKKELYGKLEVVNATHLMWDVYAAANNEHEDSILVMQQRHGSFGKAGDDAYEALVQLRQLPPAPFVWHPPSKHQNSLFNAFYSLPPDTRKVYLLTLCCTLLVIIICILTMPRFRKKIFGFHHK